MADKKILDNEILSDEELDNVAGGTVSETYQLRKAIGEVYFVKDGQPAPFYTYLPENEVAGYLKKTYNIDATLNFGDYDPASHDYVTEGDPNQYSINGKSLTHQQVLGIINIANGK